MFKWIITLVFLSIMAIINASDLIVLLNSNITSVEEATQHLAEIQSDDALPVVLIETSVGNSETEMTYILQPPEDLLHTLTVNRKIMGGTLFSTKGSKKQIFFCPKQYFNEKCLAPQEFEYTLKCSEQPTPVVLDDAPSPIPCSFLYGSTSHAMAYNICPTQEPYKYKKWEFKLYKFCYNDLIQKTLHTTHLILSPNLLKSKLLYREQQLHYPYSANGRFLAANFYEIVNSLNSEIASFIKTSKPMYRVQKLVPSEDMALGTWRKTTYEMVNLELQHKWLFSFWNEINDKVREEAIRVYDSGVSFCVITGVFDLNNDISVEYDDGEIYNMWVKVIYSLAINDFKALQVVVFMMNNFLDFITENPQLKSLQTEIIKYCPNDLCDDSFKHRVGGRVRCCPMTRKIIELFGQERIDIIHLPVLQIPGLTKIPT